MDRYLYARPSWHSFLRIFQKPPTDPHDIRSEIARMKAERLAKLDARDPSEAPAIKSDKLPSSGRFV